MVDRLHSPLKAAIKLHMPEKWVDTLSVVLLGLQSSLKEDIVAVVSELVYCITLRHPYEFLGLRQTSVPDPKSFVDYLRETIRKLQPISSENHVCHTPLIYENQNSGSHVFVRHDVSRKSLQPTFDRPFKILSSTVK